MEPSSCSGVVTLSASWCGWTLVNREWFLCSSVLWCVFGNNGPFYLGGGAEGGGAAEYSAKLQLFKKPFRLPWPLCLGQGCVGVEEGHAERSFLLPVRTLSGIQPELINSNRPPHYPGCTGP